MRTILRSFFGSSPGLGERLLVLDDVVGRLHDDGAGRVEAGPAGPAGDLVELAGLELPRAARRRTCSAPVSSTVRIGTLMPTPRVSVPQITLSSPAWASCSTSRRYFGSMPGVVHADAVPHQPRQRLAEAGGEPEVADQLGDRVLLGPACTR